MHCLWMGNLNIIGKTKNPLKLAYMVFRWANLYILFKLSKYLVLPVCIVCTNAVQYWGIRFVVSSIVLVIQGPDFDEHFFNTKFRVI